MFSFGITVDCLILSLHSYGITLPVIFQKDLVNTIGETVALGASGMVMWGTLGLVRSMVS